MGSAARNDSQFTLLDGDEDVLLDFDNYSSTKSRWCPSLPGWWYRLSTRQRGIARGFLWGCLVVAASAVLIYRLSVGNDGSSQSQSQRSPPLSDDPMGYHGEGTTRPTTTPTEPRPTETPPYTEPAWSTNVPSPDTATQSLVEDYTEYGDQAPGAISPPPPADSTMFPRCSWASYRLPATITPFLYDISLQLNPALSHYNGTVRIALSLDEATPCIVLHADRSLNLQVGPLETASGTVPVELQRPEEDHDGQLHVVAGAALPAGHVFVTLRFGAAISSGLLGLYQSHYTTAAGEADVLVVTQFESMSARKAFPCLDEPALKAPVQMAITAASNVSVLFNTDATVTVAVGGGMVAHTFQKTPPMATYLIAIVAGDLVKHELLLPRSGGPDAAPLPVRVWGRRSVEESLTLAAHSAVAAVQGMEEAVGVPYADGKISKLDLVGIPDFQAGAMENWGLITFRETDLLAMPGDPATGGASVQTLYHVPMVVAHEVSHMWFGGLVTLPWWTDLWLNEGFAEYFERIAAGHLWNRYDKADLPQEFTAPGKLNYMGGFVAEVLDRALEFDALPSTFALSRPEESVQTQADAASAFGLIAYEKGSSVLRMLHAHMLRRAAGSAAAYSGAYERPEWSSDKAWQMRRLLREAGGAEEQEDMFFRALHTYLGAYKFGTGHTDTLLEAMESTTGMPVKMWGEAWTKQKGSPLVTVCKVDGKLRAAQVPPDVADPVDAPTWWIPITYCGLGGSGAALRGEQEGGEEAVPWVELHAAATEVEWPEAAAAVKVNCGQLGVYRVNYTEELWEALHEQASALPPADFAGLLADTWALASDGNLRISHFLRFAASLVDRSFPQPAPAAAPAPAIVRPELIVPVGLADGDLPPAVVTALPAPGPAPVPIPLPSLTLKPAPAPLPAVAPPQTQAAPQTPATPPPPPVLGPPPADYTPADPDTAPDRRHSGNMPSAAAAQSNKPSHESHSKPHSPANSAQASPATASASAPARGDMAGDPRRTLAAAAPPGVPPRGGYGSWRALMTLNKLYKLIDAAEVDGGMSCRDAFNTWVGTGILWPAARAVGLSISAPPSDGDTGSSEAGVAIGADEPWEVRMTRATVAQLHTELGATADVAELAAEIVPRYLAGEGPLHADVRGALLAVAVQTEQGGGLVERVRAHLEASSDPVERDRALRALACDGDTERAFDYVRSGKVRSQDVLKFVEGVAALSQERRQEMWKLCYFYRDTLKALFGGTGQERLQATAQVMAKVASGFASERRAMDAEAVFRQVLPGDLPQYVLEALDKIRANAAAKDRVVPGVCEWLQMPGGGLDSVGVSMYRMDYDASYYDFNLDRGYGSDDYGLIEYEN